MIDKFTKAYLQWFYDASSIKWIPQMICQSTQMTLNDLYKNIYIVKNDDQFKNILCQSVEEVNYGQKLVSKIINGNDAQKYFANNFKDDISKHWKYYNLINDQMPVLYVYKFDFNDYQPMKKLLSHHFPKLKNQINSNEGYNLFKINCSEVNGCVFNFGTFLIMILNQNQKYHFSNVTVNHQLTHYFQETLHINLLNIDDMNFIDLPPLQLSIQKQKYGFNQKQFIPHVLVDFLSQLKKIFYVKYQKMFSKQQFITYIFNFIQKNPLNIYNSDFGRRYLSMFKHKDIFPLSLICAAKFYNLKYNFIKQKCYEEFK